MEAESETTDNDNAKSGDKKAIEKKEQTIFISNLDYYTSENTIRDIFSKVRFRWQNF